MQLVEHDRNYISKKFNVTPRKGVGVKLESVTSIKQFYLYLLDEIKLKNSA